jgi:hypothetical protein
MQSVLRVALSALLLCVLATNANAQATTKKCGTFPGGQCAAHQFCQFPAGTCAVIGGMGVCVIRPQVCSFLYDPVCGCDGETYGNKCQADMAGVSIAHPGQCTHIPSGPGPVVVQHCSLYPGGACREPNTFCQFPIGVCGSHFHWGAPGTCINQPKFCPENLYDPVCGCDHVTYDNTCLASMHAVSILHQGRCEQPIDSSDFEANVLVSGDYFCNIHHNCPNDGVIRSTRNFSKPQCKTYPKCKSRGNGPAGTILRNGQPATCDNINK